MMDFETLKLKGDMLKGYRPQILGMSGLPTTTIERMPEFIAVLSEAGLRKSTKVVVAAPL